MTEALLREKQSAALARSAALSDAEMRAKAKFLSNMSHELRTPLNAIIGFNDVMRQELFGPLGNEQYRAYAEHATDAAHGLLRTVGQILDMSLLYGEELDIQESEFELGDAVSAVVAAWRDACDRKRVSFHWSAGGPPIRMRGDRNKLVQALENIVDNAVKFSLPDSRIEVSLARVVGGAAVITVADGGIGIAPDRIAGLLTPFEQAESAQARQHHGTGLGLPLALGMIRLHGGEIAIDSRPGTGTTVKITLPADRVIAGEADSRSPTAA